MTKYISVESAYDKIAKHPNKQEGLIVKFMIETGVRASEVRSIIAITNESITVRTPNGIREVFHNIGTTSQLTNLNRSTNTIRRIVKRVLGEEYTPGSVRASHARHLLESGANPKMVQLQLGLKKDGYVLRYLK